MKPRELLRAIGDVFAPRTCPVCHNVLDTSEDYLCRACLASVPRTRFEEVGFNAFEQLFAGRVPVERAASYFFYERGSGYAGVLHDMKYRSLPGLAVWLGARAAREMEASGFFKGIEALVPVPLHPSKLASRGYNQSERVCRGIASEIGAPVLNALEVAREHDTQTHKDALERLKNVEGAYRLRKKFVKQLENKHVLLVDDVVTTGATMLSCARELKRCAGLKLSLFTIAAARNGG